MMSIFISGRVNAKTSATENIAALLASDIVPSIVCHGLCRGSYPEVSFCVLCGICQMQMYYVGDGYTEVCTHI